MGRRAIKLGTVARRRIPCIAHHDLPQRHTCMQRHAEARASGLRFSCHTRCLLEAEQRLSSGREMVRFESRRRGMDGKEGRTAPTHSRTHLTFLVEQSGTAFCRPGEVGATLLSQKGYPAIKHRGLCACFSRLWLVVGLSDVRRQTFFSLECCVMLEAFFGERCSNEASLSRGFSSMLPRRRKAKAPSEVVTKQKAALATGR